MVNIILRGRVRDIVKTMVDDGYANSQSEGIRLAIVDFGKHYLSEEELVNSKLDRIGRAVQDNLQGF